MREFRRWAGYTPRPEPSGGFAFGIGAVAAAGAGAEAGATADTPPEVSNKVAAVATVRGVRQSRARNRSDVVAAPASGDERGDQASSRALTHARAHARARARSVSARSMACAASGGGGGGGGRMAKRSKSSGPPGRGVRGRSQLRTPGSAAAGDEQATGGRAPWGAGPRVGGARARAQAWASTHLDNAKPYGFGGGSGGGGGGEGGGTGRARKSDGASGGTITARSRARVRRGRVAGGGGGYGGTHAAARNLVANETGRNVRGGNRVGRKASRRGAGAGSTPRRRGGAIGGDGGEPGKVRGVGFGAEQSTCGHPLGRAGQDITWDVLEDEGCDNPGFRAPREGGRGFHEGAGNGIQDDARTGRVVEMLASLEKAVVDVCKVR